MRRGMQAIGLSVLLGCTSGGGGQEGGPSGGIGNPPKPQPTAPSPTATAESQPATSLWQPGLQTIELYAAGGGPAPPPAEGEDCPGGPDSYTFFAQTGELSWSICVGKSGGLSTVGGRRALTSDEQARLVDALRAVSVSRNTPQVCFPDEGRISVTRRTAEATQTYVGCGPEVGAGSVGGDLETAFDTARALAH